MRNLRVSMKKCVNQLKYKNREKHMKKKTGYIY